MSVTLRQDQVAVVLPRKVVLALSRAQRNQHSGNFTLHLRFGDVMGSTFEVKESYSEIERRDTIALG